MFGPSDPFGIGSMFPDSAASAPKKKKEEKGLPWEAKTINGKMYLPLAQVVELLKQNDVLPAVRKGLEKHL